MLIKPLTLTLALVLTAAGQTTPKPGLWEVNSRLTGKGGGLGSNLAPMTAQDKKCITSELWAAALAKPTMPPQCTILSGEGEKTNHKELNYACRYAPGRRLNVHMVTDVLSPEAIRVWTTQQIKAGVEVDTTLNILTYTFLSDSCGAVQPATPLAVPQ